MNFVRRHPVLTALALLFLGWQAWNPVMHLFFGGKHVLKDAIEGEWVGTVEITRGYYPARMGNTPGPHEQAVLHFNLAIDHMFEVDYKGPGEFFIIGENKARKIAMELRVAEDSRISGQMDSKPNFAGQIDGNYLRSAPNDMTISADGMAGELTFNGHLHQGTIAEYNALVNKLQGEAVISKARIP